MVVFIFKPSGSGDENVHKKLLGWKGDPFFWDNFTNIAETTLTDRGVASISTSCRPPADFRFHIC